MTRFDQAHHGVDHATSLVLPLASPHVVLGFTPVAVAIRVIPGSASG